VPSPLPFVLGCAAGLILALVIMCVLCKLGIFAGHEPEEVIVLPEDWTHVQRRRIRMKIPQLSTITAEESNPITPDCAGSSIAQDASTSAPLLSKE
ncbi:hypothetical protein PMAYCL1PPCAC_32509, partial [Pristionchus mayeri]